jgi:YggT family protein
MRELLVVVDSVMLLVLSLFLLRLLFQLLRGDFRNPLLRVIVRLTDPVVLPLRRVLPPIGRVDTASVVAVVLAQLLWTALTELLQLGRLPPVGLLLIVAAARLLDTTLLVFLIAMILYVVLSWVAPDNYSPMSRLLGSLVEPVLRPFRRAIPAFGGLDWSVFVACIVIVLLRMILSDRIVPALLSMF